MRLYGYKTSRCKSLGRICGCCCCEADERRNRNARKRNRKRARRWAKNDIKEQI